MSETESDREPQTTAGRAWKATNDEMEAIAEERQEEGWEVASMPAVHTSPVSRESGDDPDRYGLVHIIPDNHSEAFEGAYQRGSFPEYLAYRNQIEFAVFLLTEFIDPGSETIILVAGHYDARKAVGMANTVREVGKVKSYARTLNGRALGEFVHEDPDPLMPATLPATHAGNDETSPE